MVMNMKFYKCGSIGLYFICYNIEKSAGHIFERILLKVSVALIETVRYEKCFLFDRTLQIEFKNKERRIVIKREKQKN